MKCSILFFECDKRLTLFMPTVSRPRHLGIPVLYCISPHRETPIKAGHCEWNSPSRLLLDNLYFAIITHCNNSHSLSTTMKFFTVASVLALPLLAVARATPSPPSGSVEQCNTGSIQCCNSFQSVSNDGIAGILGLLGVVTQGETTLFGINCSPIDILGVGGNSWCVVFPLSPHHQFVFNFVVLSPKLARPNPSVARIIASVSISGCLWISVDTCIRFSDGLVVIGCTPINVGL